MPDPQHPATSPEDVTVDRHLPKSIAEDHLYCKHLELRLRHKESAPAASTRPGQPKPSNTGTSSPDSSVEIESARATGGTREVLLISDAEKLRAECDEFIHDTRKGLTILRGIPEIEADHDGSLIHCPELQIQDEKDPAPVKVPNGSKPRTYQRSTAKGPGRIDMWNKEKEKSVDHAAWRDLLTSSRDGPFDLLVLTGAARFLNDEQPNQPTVLQGDTLKVWLRPREPEAQPTAKSQPAAAPAPRPDKIEAIGNVFFKSLQLIVHDTSRLVVTFKDGPPAVLPDPSTSPTGPTAPTGPIATHVTDGPVYETAKPAGPAAPLPAGPAPETVPTTAASGPKAPAKAEEPARPLDLSARTVDATVLCAGRPRRARTRTRSKSSGAKAASTSARTAIRPSRTTRGSTSRAARWR